MSKRKTIFSDDDEEFLCTLSSPKAASKKKRPKIILDNTPPVNSIKELIEVGKTLKFYKNINSIMLWDILPYLEELDSMIGMDSLKESVFFQIIYYLQGMHYRNKNEEYLHTIILGNPGCGKTKVAKILGKIYQNMGILSKNGNFKIGYRDNLVGEYLGQTAVKTRKFLESCLGGVVFIDEVYSLGPGQKDKDSFSKEAIDTLCSFLSEHKNDFCCIVAGYEDDVKKCFLSVNKGLERRFPWVHKIEVYTNENLSDIFTKMINDFKWKLDKNVDKKYLIDFFKENNEHFKNTGGDIETFLSKCKLIHSKRVFCLDKEFKFIFTKEDIEQSMKMVKNYKLEKVEEKNFSHMFMYT
jgi:SpoVK/Ycf46/Vps4 family AAA+-type ATPase